MADRDPSTWRSPSRELALGALVAAPAALNRRERWWAAAWAGPTLIVELAVVFWVVLMALALGPR